jgi:hypothetical protein
MPVSQDDVPTSREHGHCDLIFSKYDTSTASGTLIDFEHGTKVFSVQFPDKTFRHT